MINELRENKFQAGLIKELKAHYPGCLVTKNDSAYIQGIPDLSILYRDRYALLECKQNKNAHRQPNQEYYIGHVNEMGGFARFIYPENKENVLHDLDEFFK